MKILNYLLTLCILCAIVACTGDTLPKPKSQLSLSYPVAAYNTIDASCAYSFEKNNLGTIKFKDNCSATITYPQLNGSIFLTYRKVDNNINALLKDAQKLTYEHVNKADNIIEVKYINEIQNAYGMFYDVKGNAASQSQFYITDSTKHFLTGAIYFNTKPNYDSIYPAAVYLKNDISHLMETIVWEE